MKEFRKNEQKKKKKKKKNSNWVFQMFCLRERRQKVGVSGSLREDYIAFLFNMYFFLKKICAELNSRRKLLHQGGFVISHIT